MILTITAHHIAQSRRIEPKGHHNFLNPIAVALHDTDPCAYVTPTKVHRTCPHGWLCKLDACQPSFLNWQARQWLENYNRNPYSATPTQIVI